MISCEQATTICTKSQYREAGARERFQLWLHLLFCRSCAHFTRKNRKLTDLCNRAPLQRLSEPEKEELKRCLRETGTP